MHNPPPPVYDSPPSLKLEVKLTAEKYQESPPPKVASAVLAQSQGSEILSVMHSFINQFASQTNSEQLDYSTK